MARVGYGIAIVPSPTQLQRGKALGAWAAIAWDPHRFQPPFVERFVEELAAYSSHSYPGKGLVRGRILASVPKR